MQLAEAAQDDAAYKRYKRMEAAWLALAEEQDWLDGERSLINPNAGLKGEEMSVRGSNWTAEEDQRLVDFIKAGKSWVFIAAALKRTTRSIQDRVRELKAKK
jgi:hypothetical protein